MKQKLLLLIAIVSGWQLYPAANGEGEGKALAGQKETKKTAGEKELKKGAQQSLITASTLGGGVVTFYAGNQPVKFNLVDVGSADSVKIFDLWKDGDNYLIDGIVYKASNVDNKFFMVEFGKDKSGKEWQFPRVIFQQTMKEVESSIRGQVGMRDFGYRYAKGSEWIHGLTIQGPKPVVFAVAFAWNTFSNRLTVAHYNAAQATWEFRMRDPFANPQGAPGRLAGYEKAEITKINSVTLQPTENPYIYQITITFELAGVDTKKIPITMTQSWDHYFRVGD